MYFFLQMCKWQSIEGEEKVTTRLVELLEKMRLMLYKASQTGLRNFCSQIKKCFIRLKKRIYFPRLIGFNHQNVYLLLHVVQFPYVIIWKPVFTQMKAYGRSAFEWALHVAQSWFNEFNSSELHTTNWKQHWGNKNITSIRLLRFFF